MSNYRESTVTGTQWTRSNVVVVSNEWGSTPRVSFGEETRIAIDGATVSRLLPEE